MTLPAVLGGNPVRPQGPPAWPCTDPDILDVLQNAYREGWWGRYQAGFCERLENWLKEYHHVEHVFLCGSGNYAVELGLRALGIDAGDEVILADYDYPGNFLSIHAVGATPVLVNVEPSDWNLSLAAVREAIGPKTKAILASHLHGGCVAMSQLMEFAKERGLSVVEDAAQCPGAMIAGRRAGSWGYVGVLSFGGSKLLTAGRGGALLTNNAQIAQRARNHLLRAGNIVCPLSELQAALLLPQCEKLDERNEHRWKNVQALIEALRGSIGVQLFCAGRLPAADDLPAFYKVGIQYDATAFGLSRERFIRAMRAEGFALDEGFEAAHRTRSPRRFRQGSTLTEAEGAHAGCVMLHHPLLLESTASVLELVVALEKVRQHASEIHAAGEQVGAFPSRDRQGALD